MWNNKKKKRHLLFYKKIEVNHLTTAGGPRHSFARQNYGDKTKIRMWVTPPGHFISAWLWKTPTLLNQNPFQRRGLNKSHVQTFTDVAKSWDQTWCLIDSHHMAPAPPLPAGIASQGCGRRRGCEGARAVRCGNSQVTFIDAAPTEHPPITQNRRSAQLGLAPGGTKQTQKTHLLPAPVKATWEQLAPHTLHQKIIFFFPH